MAFEIVPFDGDEILGIRGAEGKAFVVVKRICENLKVAHQSQLEKLKGYPWSGITTIVTPDARGHQQETWVIPLDSLPMWLATIAPGRVKEEVRDKLVRYQKEVRDVLARHFLGGMRSSAPTIDTSTRTFDMGLDDPQLAMVRQLGKQWQLLEQLVVSRIEHEREIVENRRVALESKQIALESKHRSEVAELKVEAAESKVGEIDRKIEAVQETIIANTRWMTAMGHCKKHGIERTVHELARDGKMMSAMCRAEKITPRKVHSEVFGEVNIYPEHIRDRYYRTESGRNGSATIIH